jgi:hypothetical protein
VANARGYTDDGIEAVKLNILELANALVAKLR